MSKGHHDEAFAQTLSRFASDVAPTIDVDTSRVVSTARRRRDRRRSVAAGALGVVVLAGAAVAQTSPWTPDPVIAAHDEPGARSTDERGQVTAPAVQQFDAVSIPDDAPVADDGAALPTAVTVPLGAAGVAALGAGAWFAVRSRRHQR